MNININDSERYIPAIGGNDKEAEPIVFNLRFLTVRDLDESEYYEIIGAGKNNRVKGKINFVDLFSRGVESIEGCTVNGKAITNAIDFLAVRGVPLFKSLMQDVAQHLHDVSEIDSPNSK